jgi:hypothetical protein
VILSVSVCIVRITVFGEHIQQKEKNYVPINSGIPNIVVALCVFKIHARIQRVTDPRPRNLTEIVAFFWGFCDFLRFLYACASAVL